VAGSLLALAVALSVPSAASAAKGKVVFEGCQSSSQGPPTPGCSPLEGLSYTEAFAVSLDGRSAYASRPDGLNVFARDPSTGELSLVQCFDAQGDPPCGQAPGIRGAARDIAVPHDGLSVYVAGRDNTLVGFKRDLADGRLTFSSCRLSSYGGDPGVPDCPPGEFQEALQVEASRDGRSIYLATDGCADNTGDCFASIAVYVRDPLTSALVHSRSSDPATQRPGPIAVTPTTGTVYEVDSGFGTISVFKRIGNSGLKRIQCLWPRKQEHAGPCKRVRKMGRARAIAVSPQGHSVVTAVYPKRGGSWLTLFSRAGNGKLTFAQRLVDGRLRSADDLRFTSDGRTLLAASGAGADSFLLRFTVNPRKNRITPAECLSSAKRKGCTQVPLLRGLRTLAAFNLQLYGVVADPSVATGLNALVRFRLPD
jgi:hypothetical protein